MRSIPIQRWVDQHVARMRIGQFLQWAADVGAGFLFAFGGIVLVTKLLIPGVWPHVLWLSVGIVPALAAAWWCAARQPWAVVDSIAWMDRSLKADGLLMTLAECPDAAWQERLPQLEMMWRESLPRIRPRRFGKYMLFPLAFAVAACFVPLREANTSPHRQPLGEKQAQQLDELLEKLDQFAVIEPVEEKQLKEEVAKLSQESKEKPLTQEKWEAIDALRERLRERVESANSLNAQALEALQSLAEESAGETPPFTPGEMKQADELLKKLRESGEAEKLLEGASPELKEAVKKLLEKNSAGSKPDDPAATPEEQQAQAEMLQKLAEKLQKDPQASEELRAAAEQVSQGARAAAQRRQRSAQRQEGLQKNLGNTLQKLQKRGALKKAPQKLRDQLARLNKTGEKLDLPQDPQERQQMLKELQEFLDQESSSLESLQKECSNCKPGDGDQESLDSESGSREPGECQGGKQGNCKGGRCRNGNRPGKGGISRGRGDADMSWGDEATKNGVRFKEIELPDGAMPDPKDEILNITRTTPTDKPGEIGPRGPAHALAPATGNIAVNRKLTPHHRDAVRRYFDTPADKSGKK